MKSSNLHPYSFLSVTSNGFLWYVVVFLGAWLVTVTTGAGHEIRDLRGQESDDVVMEKVDENFQVQQDLNFHYETDNRREPFLPLVNPQNRQRNSSLIEPSKTDPSTWKLVGVVSGMQGYFASIQTPEGKRYIVTPGSVIPSEGLIVKRISKTELEFGYIDERNATTDLEGPQQLIVSF